MELVVNGDRGEWADGSTVAALVARHAEPSQRIAVAVNGAVVPRSEWPVTGLRDGDAVELLTAAAGG